MAVERRADEGNARGFLEDLVGLARLHGAAVEARAESFESFAAEAPMADVSIFGLGPDPHFGVMRRLVEDTRSTCLFVRDSGQESALA